MAGYAGAVLIAQMRSGTIEKILDLLRTQFAETGATHGELKKAFVAAKLGSESTFNRLWKELKPKKLIVEGENRRFKLEKSA